MNDILELTVDPSSPIRIVNHMPAMDVCWQHRDKTLKIDTEGNIVAGSAAEVIAAGYPLGDSFFPVLLCIAKLQARIAELEAGR